MSTISKYFKVLNENVNSDENKNSDSPYKNVLNDIKALDLNSSNESNEFKTPKLVSKVNPKNLPKNTNTKKPSAKRCLNKKTRSPDKFNNKEKNYNLEHIHMAIALSKSLQDRDNEETNKCLDESNRNKYSTCLMDIFEQYKFRSSTNCKLQSSNRRTLLERKRHKSKFQYVTPVLLLRTQEDRERLISNKISLILTNNTSLKTNRETGRLENMCSKVLQEYYRCEEKTFNKTKYTTETMLNDFYIKGLKIDRCAGTCGSLLKNWHEIPGRSESPTFTELSCPPSVLDNRCISPDLFDSDDEQRCLSSPILKSSFLKLDTDLHSTVNVNSFDEQPETSTSGELFENEKGICVFEKFSEPKVCVNLSQLCNEDCETEETNSEEELQQSLKAGVSKTFQKIVSLASNDDTIDYVYKLLEREANQKSKGNSFRKPVKLGDEHEDLYTKEINLLCLRSSLLNQSDTLKGFDSGSEASKDDNGKDDSVRPEIFTSTNSEESISISDDEINYSCLHSTPTHVQRKRRLSKKGSFYSLSEDSHSSDSFTIPNDDAPLVSNPINENTTTSSTKQFITISASQNPGAVINLESGDLETTVHSSDSFTIPNHAFYQEKNSHTHFASNAIDEVTVSASIKHFITDSALQNAEAVVNLKSEDLESTVLYDMLSKKEELKSEDKNDNLSTPKTVVTVKSSDVTPMAEYNDMNTPKIVKELDKFGLKPLKRQRGVQLLKYIYETTHPFANNPASNYENGDRNKKRKIDSYGICEDNVTPTSSNNEESLPSVPASTLTKIGKNILGPNEELVFERKQPKKLSSCVVPLQIAWHNLVSSDPNIQRKILLYEPLQLEDLYQTLKSQGYKYHIQDLLTFLDRKCITIRTDQSGRIKPKQRKKSKTQLNFDQS